MIAPPMERVSAELELWRAAGRRALFWIRDDDACGVTGQLERLHATAAHQAVKVGLAVIPGLLEPELVDFLGAHAAAFFPMCHGWKHINHGDDSDPSEFGAGRPHAEARRDAISALETFRARFAGTPAVFVPPFGRISSTMIGALPEIGFSGLSGGQRPLERRAARLAARFDWAPGLNIARTGPLPRVDAHIDLIDWRARSAEDIAIVADRVVGQLRLRRKGFLAAGTPIGLLTHHRIHDEKIWQLLEGLVDFLNRHGAEFADIAGMFHPLAEAVDCRSGARCQSLRGQTPQGTEMRRLSVIIKAYNEAENIARAITSSLQAVAPYRGEVILADGASTDRTVEIASRYPTTIVVLRHPQQRCCGVGPQLGFPHTDGEYVYMLDGDMELDASFIAKAIAYLDDNPDVAGVGGAVLETRAPNSEFRSRINRLNRLSDKEADMFCLNGGGLYRRAALTDVGYMSDQNLHGSEEYDLGARLRGKGWRIVRLPDHAADHFAHQLKTLPLLWRRVRNGQLLSLGEVVRASLEAGYFTKLLGEMRVLQLAMVVWIYWLLAALTVTASHSWALAAGLFLLGPAMVIAGISYRHRALDLGCLSFVGWHLAAGGLLLGLLRKRVPPLRPIDCSVVSPGVPPQGEATAPGEEARSREAAKSLARSDR